MDFVLPMIAPANMGSESAPLGFFDDRFPRPTRFNIFSKIGPRASRAAVIIPAKVAAIQSDSRVKSLP